MTLRVIQVGLGPWGLNWAQQVTPSVSQVDVIAYVARRRKSLANARSVLNLPGSLFFDSLEKALSTVDADAVLILTDTAPHAILIETALSAGKHVLVEKPFTETSSDAERLATLAEKRDLVLMVNQNFRYFPATLTALEIVRSNTLGDIKSIDVDFRWRVDYPTYDAGRSHYECKQALLMDMSIHHFDLMRLMAGSEPLSIYCEAWQPAGSQFVDPAAAAAIIRFRNDVTISYRASWLSRDETTTFSGDWRMEMERGVLQWCCRKDRDLSTDGDAVLIRRPGAAAEPVALPKVEHFGRAGALAAFATSIEAGIIPEWFSSARDNIGSVRLMEAAVASATTNSVINLT